MSNLNQDEYNELSYYILTHPDNSFIHQHIIDAYIAQTADKNTKPIGLTFSLVGLYLYIEKNYTGKQIQQLHMKMAKNKKAWPLFKLPEKRGNTTISDVLQFPPGLERDKMIRKWCISIWEAHQDDRQKIIDLLENELEEE
jgi:hypothetical protein